MFESNQDQQFLQEILQKKQPNQAAANLQDTPSYGLTDNNQFNKSALDDQVLGTLANDPWSAADGAQTSLGATLTDDAGDVLIQGGNTTVAEQNEVNNLLSQRRFNRDWNTSNRGFRNRTTGTGSFSADERAGFDRTDSRGNAFNLGTVAYRQGKNVQGQIGYTHSGVRDKNDWFKFTAGKTGTYNFSLSGLGSNAGLALYSASGNLLDFSDRAGRLSESFSERLSKGTYYARAYSYGERPWNHGATNYCLNISKRADGLEQSLKTLIRDQSVENAALNSIKYDNRFSRNDVIGVLKSAGDHGAVTGTELADLRRFWNRTDHLMRNDIKVLSEKVVFHDDSNQWYTGSDSVRDSLGDLAAGSSRNDLNLLIGKHMFGTDRPAITRDSSGTLRGSYTTAGGSLTDGSVSHDDVDQGAIGTCYLLAGLAGTANDKPGFINDMFTSNGDGTWSVRFHTNGKVDYVTVDRQMATMNDGSGRYLYANDGADNGSQDIVANNNELWVALAEKAYAQVNESGRISQDGTNSYQGISGGHNRDATRHITGIAATDEQAQWSAIAGVSQAELINMVNSNRVVTTGYFNGNASTDDDGDGSIDWKSNSTTNIGSAVQGHAYSIVGYDASTQRFDIRNPWDNRHLSLTHTQLRQLGARITSSNS